MSWSEETVKPVPPGTYYNWRTCQLVTVDAKHPLEYRPPPAAPVREETSPTKRTS